MTKQDILNMDKTQDIMKALANAPELWSEDVSNHMLNIKRKKNIAEHGEADILYTPAKK